MSRSEIVGTSLIVPVVVGVLSITSTMSGCGLTPQGTAGNEPALPQPIAEMAAGDTTAASIGVRSWSIYQETPGIRIDGLDEQGSVLHQIHIRMITTKLTRNGHFDYGRGYEFTTSSGGLLRVTTEGRVLKRIDDRALLGSFALDVETMKEQYARTPYSCTVLDGIICAGSILLAVAACEVFSLECVGAILTSAVCYECAAALFGGGGNSGGGGGGTGGGGGCTNEAGEGVPCDFPIE